eukprot:TRINITY_DN93604_c0_g1_i1.p1 TRINITY_DN93604_c0_g1~~TRINITY_DN93604_c0_g1_i1.p1  ORF type:complete len:279 (+),score=66.44 TRINITY_DN93604_c0_g1_i1:53-838(+)
MAASRFSETLGVIVTGGSSGIGRSLVQQLVQRKYVVFATGRQADALKELESQGIGWSQGDVASPEDVARHWQEALAFFKQRGAQPFGLCLNAGCAAGRAPLEQLSPEQIDRVLNTNVKGVMLWLREALPLFKEKRCGQVVLTSSLAAVRTCPEQTLYAASKFALHGMLLSLRAELKGSGVKVGSVNPGAVATPWWNDETRGGYSDVKRNEVKETAMWNSMLSPDDVAAQIIALLEQPASANTECVMMEPSDGSGCSPGSSS